MHECLTLLAASSFTSKIVTEWEKGEHSTKNILAYNVLLY